MPLRSLASGKAGKVGRNTLGKPLRAITMVSVGSASGAPHDDTTVRSVDTAASPDAPMETTKRLDSIMSSFDAFDTDMKVGTRQRREKDEFKVFLMKKQMAQLERQLNSEIKRRTEMNKSMQTWTDQQIAETRAGFVRQVGERRVKLAERVDALRERISDMKKRFDVDIEAIPVDIESRGRELASRLHGSMEEFEIESKSRLEREAAILKRLADNESSVANQFDADRTAREKHYVRLRETLEGHVKRRGKADEKLKTKLNEELARLKNTITMESKIRWREDAELAAAMNGYVEKLQQSLYIVNSDIV